MFTGKKLDMSRYVESLEIWETEVIVPKCIVIQKVNLDNEGIKIFFRESGSKANEYVLTFKNFLGYRCFDEGDRLKLQAEWSHILTMSSIFYSKNSQFLEWAIGESYEIREKSKLTHFIIGCSNWLVDVLTFEEPTLQSNDSSLNNLN